MSNPARVVRWNTPDGKTEEHHFPAGHADKTRRDFLQSLFLDPRRVAPGSMVTVTDEPTKRTKARKSK